MTRIFRTSRFTYGAPLSAIAVSAMLLIGTATGADAWHYGRGHAPGVVGGAIVGGAIGAAIGGKKGILPGVIGGAIIGGSGVLETPAYASPRRRPPPPPPPPPIYNSGLVYNIQTSLMQLGYRPGPVDGVYGQLTADAISAYEYNNRLPVTAQPSQGLYSHMIRSGG